MSAGTIYKKKGFTLIELLAIITIISILASIALPGYRRSVERARVAEALTLMRAIYDSCERLAWENGYDTDNETITSCSAAVADNLVTFPKLDIVAKGTFSNSGKTLTTANFEYTLGTEAASVVTAKFIMPNNYQNATITFNGALGTFSCSPANEATGEAAKVCEVWGANTWNEGE